MVQVSQFLRSQILIKPIRLIISTFQRNSNMSAPSNPKYNKHTEPPKKRYYSQSAGILSSFSLAERPRSRSQPQIDSKRSVSVPGALETAVALSAAMTKKKIGGRQEVRGPGRDSKDSPYFWGVLQLFLPDHGYRSPRSFQRLLSYLPRRAEAPNFVDLAVRSRSNVLEISRAGLFRAFCTLSFECFLDELEGE